MRAWLHEHLADLHAYLGLALLACGAGWAYLPAGLMVAGLGLLWLAWHVAADGGGG